MGVSDDDDTHDPECMRCERCEDNVPIILFSGEGDDMKQAAFHNKCFMMIGNFFEPAYNRETPHENQPRNS
jgi:hypothetical protein